MEHLAACLCFMGLTVRLCSKRLKRMCMASRVAMLSTSILLHPESSIALGSAWTVDAGIQNTFAVRLQDEHDAF